MFHRRANGLSYVPIEAGRGLARLTGFEGFARAMLVGVIPLLAYEAVGDKETVARIYLVAAVLTLSITINFARLEKLLQRRWVVTLAGGFLVSAAAVFYWAEGPLFAVGIGLRAAAASLFSVCLSLYIMENITKSDLVVAESRRMQINGIGWLIGPSLGVWLWGQNYHASTFMLSALMAVLGVAYFWRLRLGNNTIIRAAKTRSANPLVLIQRYFSQKHLRIAYAITLSRSMFWVTVFVYGPIYVVEAGLPGWMAGALLSCVSGLLFFSPLVRRAAQRFGTRTIIITGLCTAGGSCAVLLLIGEPKPIGAAFWMLGAVGAACLDVLGNIPFMRNVKPYERTEMTMVFSTWREMSELLVPLSIAIISLFAPFWLYYGLISMMLLGAAVAATNLPRRL